MSAHCIHKGCAFKYSAIFGTNSKNVLAKILFNRYLSREWQYAKTYDNAFSQFQGRLCSYSGIMKGKLLSSDYVHRAEYFWHFLLKMDPQISDRHLSITNGVKKVGHNKEALLTAKMGQNPGNVQSSYIYFWTTETCQSGY